MKKVTLTSIKSNREGSFSFSYSMTIEIPDDAHPSMEGLLRKGFTETLADKFSTYKIKATGDELERDATPEEKDAWTRKAEKALQDGTYTFGGIGSRLSPEDKAMKAALKDAGYPVKKGDTIENQLELTTKTIAKEQEKEFEEGMIQTVEAELKASEVYKTTLKVNQPKKATDIASVSL